MRRPLLLASVVATAASIVVTATVFALRSRDAGAQDTSRVLYISGMQVSGDKPIAIVRITNGSENPADTMFVHYTIRGPAAGAAMSQPGAGPIGAPILAGRTLELDLGKIVSNYRKSLDLGPYSGQVQFVAAADGGVIRKFGPDIISVDAEQTQGSVKYQAHVEWR